MAVSSDKICEDSATNWRMLCERLAEVGTSLHRAAGNENESACIDRALLWMLSSGALFASQLDPRFPDWLPNVNSALRSGNPSPDNSYCIARIDGSGSYRIRGCRGSAKFVIMSMHLGFMGFTERSRLLGEYDIDNFSDRDGNFEIFVGPTSPVGNEKSWINSGSHGEDVFLSIRQVHEDWLAEDSGVFTIQRTGAEDLSHEGLSPNQPNVMAVGDYVDLYAKSVLEFISSQSVEFGMKNSVYDFSSKVGNIVVTGQSYSGGVIELADDEALIYEFCVPSSCRYWVVQLMDSFFNTLDFMFHQTGLNSFTAAPDSDGMVRMVVSRRDPGVPNWLEKGSFSENRVRFRWIGSLAPEIKCQVVPLMSVRDFLHSDTPIISADLRRLNVLARTEGAQRRRRW